MGTQCPATRATEVILGLTLNISHGRHPEENAVDEGGDG